MKPKFYATIRNGKIVFPERALYMYQLHIKTLEGKEIEITIDKRKKSRSNQQNRYYWGVVVQLLADELGYEREDIHYELRRLFLSISQDDKLSIPRSTTELSTIEFNEYIENIKIWASKNFSIYIPDVNEVDV